MDMGQRAWMKRWHQFCAWVREQSPAVTITFKYKSDYSETWKSTTFTNADELVRFGIAHRGRKLKVRFAQYDSDSPVRIDSFQSLFVGRRAV